MCEAETSALAARWPEQLRKRQSLHPEVAGRQPAATTRPSTKFLTINQIITALFSHIFFDTITSILTELTQSAAPVFVATSTRCLLILIRCLFTYSTFKPVVVAVSFNLTIPSFPSTFNRPLLICPSPPLNCKIAIHAPLSKTANTANTATLAFHFDSSSLNHSSTSNRTNARTIRGVY